MGDELNLYHWWQIATSAIAIIAGVAVFVVSYIQSKHATAMDKISNNHTAITKVSNKHSNRLTAVESALKNMPEYRNMEQVHSYIHKVDSRVSNICGQLTGIEKKLTMIDQHLMRGGK